jgi:UDP:flavonoid glycosyltransferase YjiC (YdhE family)
MTPQKVLLLPLSNVLGHLTRTFAFAEKLHQNKAEVHIATCDYYRALFDVLPKGIILHDSIEMPPGSSRSFGKIVKFEEGVGEDLINLNSANDLSDDEKELRSDYLRKMIVQDEELIQKVNPDVIITDYRYTILNLNLDPNIQVLHIANLLGFPSFYNRVRGHLFTPLDSEIVLVPGIPSLEDLENEYSQQNKNIHWLGHFQWEGWKRLQTDQISSADVFLSFGSTGNASKLIPWLFKSIDSKYSLLTTVGNGDLEAVRENVQNVGFGSLEQCLSKSRIVCCHGGHGTVMQSILHQVPMIVFPNNLEQLEIGRRIEKLGLGTLMKQPQDEIELNQLNEKIAQLLNDNDIKKRLEHFAQLLSKQNRLDRAVNIILKK